MKVCQLCAVDFTLRNFLLPLIDGMRKEGWAVTAVCSEGPFVDGLRRSGYAIDTIPIARSMNPWSALRSTIALIRYFRRERFDVVHVHTPVAALLGRIAARIAGVPLIVYTAHGFYFHDEMHRAKRSFFVALERLAGKLTDLMFSQSAEDAADAVQEDIVSSDRVLVIGNGVEVARFNPGLADSKVVRRSLGIADDAFVIGMIGRQVREKGVAEFLQAARIVAEKYPEVIFLLVGERLASDHAAGIEAEFAAAKAILGERLVAPGLRSDIPECLAAMDLFCLPSWREGMPRTIIEAMMMCKPVLATNIRGAREEVVPELTGLLVPTRSPGELAAAMSRFVSNVEFGRRLGAAGRERALLLYDERKVVALQVERIRQVAILRGML
ncbi:MAG: glycosyltransferase family 4 protein [Rhodocyclales bacterium]|nr:glycosyltransferase family 4 protein [Rhodocyclales bacterium]